MCPEAFCVSPYRTESLDLDTGGQKIDTSFNTV